MQSGAKAIYIGAGEDVMPVTYLKHIKYFVYIDCQPFSAFGVKVHECDPNCNENCVGYSRPWFVKNVITKMGKIGMKYNKISENELEFTNENQRVTYFINTAIPDHLDRVKDRIKGFDVFIVIGHDPHSEVLKYTTNKITFWGAKNTVYSEEFESEDQLTYRMCNEEAVRDKFNQYNLMLEDPYFSSYCRDHQEFATWKDFLANGKFR